MKLFAIALSIFICTSAFAAQTSCPQHFQGGEAPELITTLNQQTREVCYKEFAVKHSASKRTPVYAAEYLSPIRLLEAKDEERNDKFHPEPAIPLNERAEVKDYTKSGYDKGHMAPNADFSNQQSQFECFSMANMVPQNPNNNRGIWKKIEEAVRKHVISTNAMVFVVSGPIYDKNPKMLNGRVAVPVKLWKAFYDINTKQAGAFLVDNKAGTVYKVISLNELKVLSGVDAFPALPAKIKNTVGNLPKP